MTPIETMLTHLLGEDVRLRTHSTGVHRYVPVKDPAASPNADLWRARGAGGWYPSPDEAAVALAFDLGLRQGRAESAPSPRVVGKVEAQVVAAVQALAAAGEEVTQSTVIGATVESMATRPVSATGDGSSRGGRSLGWSGAAYWSSPTTARLPRAARGMRHRGSHE